MKNPNPTRPFQGAVVLLSVMLICAWAAPAGETDDPILGSFEIEGYFELITEASQSHDFETTLTFLDKDGFSKVKTDDGVKGTWTKKKNGKYKASFLKGTKPFLGVQDVGALKFTVKSLRAKKIELIKEKIKGKIKEKIVGWIVGRILSEYKGVIFILKVKGDFDGPLAD